MPPYHIVLVRNGRAEPLPLQPRHNQVDIVRSHLLLFSHLGMTTERAKERDDWSSIGPEIICINTKEGASCGPFGQPQQYSVARVEKRERRAYKELVTAVSPQSRAESESEI